MATQDVLYPLTDFERALLRFITGALGNPPRPDAVFDERHLMLGVLTRPEYQQTCRELHDRFAPSAAVSAEPAWMR